VIDVVDRSGDIERLDDVLRDQREVAPGQVRDIAAVTGNAVVDADDGVTAIADSRRLA
jgi:hypothetical protein